MKPPINMSRYFKHHIVARIRLSPAPVSSKEFDFLYNSFKNLSECSLEYFHIPKGQPRLNLYQNEINLIYSPYSGNITDPFFFHDEEPQDVLAQRLEQVNRTLTKLCGLPRYSYIEGDEDFFEGKITVPFKSSLTLKGLKYEGKYKISDCTVDQPFALMLSEESLTDIRLSMRHNFQKFHKFDFINILQGHDPVHQLLESKRKKRPSVGISVQKISEHFQKLNNQNLELD